MPDPVIRAACRRSVYDDGTARDFRCLGGEFNRRET